MDPSPRDPGRTYLSSAAGPAVPRSPIRRKVAESSGDTKLHDPLREPQQVRRRPRPAARAWRRPGGSAWRWCRTRTLTVSLPKGFYCLNVNQIKTETNSMSRIRPDQKSFTGLNGAELDRQNQNSQLLTTIIQKTINHRCLSENVTKSKDKSSGRTNCGPSSPFRSRGSVHSCPVAMVITSHVLLCEGFKHQNLS